MEDGGNRNNSYKTHTHTKTLNLTKRENDHLFLKQLNIEHKGYRQLPHKVSGDTKE